MSHHMHHTSGEHVLETRHVSDKNGIDEGAVVQPVGSKPSASSVVLWPNSGHPRVSG